MLSLLELVLGGFPCCRGIWSLAHEAASNHRLRGFIGSVEQDFEQKSLKEARDLAEFGKHRECDDKDIQGS